MAFFYAHLVIRRWQVNSTEYSSLTKLVKKDVNIQYWKHVQICMLIQTTEINTDAKFTGLFVYEEHGCTVRWYAGSYLTLGHHIIDVLLYTSNSLAERWYYLCLGGVLFLSTKSIAWFNSRYGASPSALKKILKLITKSCITRINLFLPLRLVLKTT